MAQSESAYRADMKYKAEKTKRVTLRFYPADEDVYAHLQKQDSMQGYVKRLIREDMGAWYEPATDEVACKVCGYTSTADRAAKHRQCPRCHGQQ